MVLDMEVDMVKDMVEDLEKIVGDMETYYGNGHAGGHGEGFRLEIRWGTWLGTMWETFLMVVWNM